MNYYYYDIMQHYWALRTQELLNSSTGDLYLYLINQCFLRGKNEISIKSTVICVSLNINKNSLSERRKVLQDADLIEFSPGLNRGESAKYKIKCINLDTQNSNMCINSDTVIEGIEIKKLVTRNNSDTVTENNTQTRNSSDTVYENIEIKKHETRNNSDTVNETRNNFDTVNEVQKTLTRNNSDTVIANRINLDTQNNQTRNNSDTVSPPYIYISNNISNNIDDDILKSENENFQKNHQSDLEAKNNNQNILRAVPVAVVDPIEGMKPSEVLKKYKPQAYLVAAKSGEIPFDKIDEQLALFDEHNVDTKFNDVTHVLNNWRSAWCKNYKSKQQKQAESSKASNQAQNVYKAPPKVVNYD